MYKISRLSSSLRSPQCCDKPPKLQQYTAVYSMYKNTNLAVAGRPNNNNNQWICYHGFASMARRDHGLDWNRRAKTDILKLDNFSFRAYKYKYSSHHIILFGKVAVAAILGPRLAICCLGELFFPQEDVGESVANGRSLLVLTQEQTLKF
jgi:hypothetical protein